MKRLLCFTLFILSIFLITGPAQALDSSPPQILSPSFSDRKTEKIELDNGLKVYIISDPQAEKSAAALAVNTGCWEDPDQFPGLAHFLEHMLFLGTKKYPKESEYQQFISSHGGQTNAMTTSLYTIYLFDIGTSAYPEALDRFSQFFKEPLFNQSGVTREMNAVNNEFSALPTDNQWRRIFVMQELTNPEHPGHRFQAGNLISLREVTTKNLRDWYESHYSSDRMYLIVYSPLPLDILEPLIASRFSDIKKQNLSQLPSLPPLFTKKTQGKIVYVSPQEKSNILSLSWELPIESSQACNSRPEEIVCHILGYEGKDSLTMLLKQKGYATELSCETIREAENMVLTVSMELTEKGAQNLYKAIGSVFSAIKTYQNSKFPQYLFDDIRNMQLLRFQYPSREKSFKEVMKHAFKLRFENFDAYPEAVDILQCFEPAQVEKVFRFLTPRRAFIDFLTPETTLPFKFDLKEKWSNIPYAIREVPLAVFQSWETENPNPMIGIPEKNPWIPRNQFLLNTEVDKAFPSPYLLADQPYGRLYFSPDHIYLTPEASLWFLIKSPKLRPGNAKDAVLAEMHLEILKEMFKKTSYDASLGGLNYDAKLTEEGISINVYGYTDKIMSFGYELAQQLKNHRISQEEFFRAKERLTRKYYNTSQKNPIQIALQNFREILFNQYVTDDEKLSEAQQVDYEEFLSFAHVIYDQIYTQSLFYGNLKHAEALDLWNSFIQTLGSSPFPEGKFQKPQVLLLSDDGPFMLEKEVNNRGNALILAIEQHPFAFDKFAGQEILSKHLSHQYFENLRTKQQTAYLVAQMSEETYGLLLNIFALESYSYTAYDLLARTELFIDQQVELLKNSGLSKDQFNSIRSALVNQLESPPDNMKTMGEELFKTLVRHGADFSWRQKTLNAFNTLEYEDFIDFSINVLSKRNRKRFAILINGEIPTDQNFNYKKIKNGKSLKQKSKYE